ncbi:MAG: hypothetical protein ACK5EA_02580, partial [Planctomycetaceae bacterium]
MSRNPLSCPPSNSPWGHLVSATRRPFLTRGGLSLGAVALQQLLADDARGEAEPSAAGSRAPIPMLPARAKRVIYLHMAGS